MFSCLFRLCFIEKLAEVPNVFPSCLFGCLNWTSSSGNITTLGLLVTCVVSNGMVLSVWCLAVTMNWQLFLFSMTNHLADYTISAVYPCLTLFHRFQSRKRKNVYYHSTSYFTHHISRNECRLTFRYSLFWLRKLLLIV